MASAVPTHPALIPLPGDPAPSQTASLTPLSQVPDLIRERNELRSQVEALLQVRNELRLAILGGFGPGQVERLLAKRDEQVEDLQNELCDEVFKRGRAERDLALTLGLIDRVAEGGGCRCNACSGSGVDQDDLCFVGHDEDEPMSIDEAVERFRDANGYDPGKCRDERCWKGWDLFVEVPAALKEESR